MDHAATPRGYINKLPLRSSLRIGFTPLCIDIQGMSGNKRYSYRLDDPRKRRLDKIEEDIEKDSRAAAIDEATRHYLAARADLEDLAEELEERYQEDADEHALGTWDLEVSVDVVE